MTKLAEAIAHEEGFYVQGSVPSVNNNPGDLEHAPGEAHPTSSPIGTFADIASGWAALEAQLQKYAERGMTVEQMVYVYAPPSENNSAAYLSYVCQYVGCTPATLVSDALQL
jgi:hypothetical protein